MTTTGPATQTRPRHVPTRLHHEPEALKWAREAKGWTRAALAEAAQVSRSHLTEIEQGRRNAPPPLLKRLAAALNCPVSLLERKREPETAA